ncbi:hypothetical protein ACKLKD_02725 [Klebsiella sp. 10982]|uniref:hypothetical protein n=1 Tax=Klebsiella TaxID=570 RepID=UPI000685E01D|nr:MULTISPECIES: hypothetical protein [Klebsiella]MEA1149228.1 hypothetical protein [Klebsiella pneumoniae]MBF7819902.1 hypothetical protein [Klebsiella quasivariicola]MBS5211341.1 hypothetical protein [Klebsiella sp.]MCJ1825970.1 hypothetical protein [Klebsiella quasivariicola]MCL7685752.1 hypothetical protein [Klebsiella quasivariicola]
MHVNVYVEKSGCCFTDLLKKLCLFLCQVLLPSTLLVSSRLLTSEYKIRDLDQILA